MLVDKLSFSISDEVFFLIYVIFVILFHIILKIDRILTVIFLNFIIFFKADLEVLGYT